MSPCPQNSSSTALLFEHPAKAAASLDLTPLLRQNQLQGNKELASAAFNARVIPSVAYTDTEIAWIGLTED